MRTNHAGWYLRELDPDPVFTYQMWLSAGGMTTIVPYNVGRKKSVINEDVLTDTTLDLTDSNGFNMTAHDFLYLCSFRNNITLSVMVDSGDRLNEAHEENNMATTTGVAMSSSDCPGELLMCAVYTFSCGCMGIYILQCQMRFTMTSFQKQFAIHV